MFLYYLHIHSNKTELQFLVICFLPGSKENHIMPPSGPQYTIIMLPCIPQCIHHEQWSFAGPVISVLSQHIQYKRHQFCHGFLCWLRSLQLKLSHLANEIEEEENASWMHSGALKILKCAYRA